MLQFHWYHQVTLISHLLLWMIRMLIFKSYIFGTSLCHTPAWAAKQHIYCMKNRLINLWMSVDNRHGCFSLQYSAHLACLSVLTRQVKCTPRCFPDLSYLIFDALLAVVRCPSLRSPPIHWSFIPTLCFRGWWSAGVGVMWHTGLVGGDR